MDKTADYLKTIGKQLLSLKSANRMTKQDQQTIEDILTITIPTAQSKLKNAKN